MSTPPITLTHKIESPDKVPFGKPLAVEVKSVWSEEERIKDLFDAWAPLEDFGPQHLPGLRKFLAGSQPQTFPNSPRVTNLHFPRQTKESLFRRSLTEHTSPEGITSAEPYAKSVRYSEVRIKVITGKLTVTTYAPAEVGHKMNVGSVKGDTCTKLYTGTMSTSRVDYLPGDTAVLKQAQLVNLNMSHDYIAIKDSYLADFAEGCLYGERLDAQGKAYPVPYSGFISKGAPGYPGISREKMIQEGAELSDALVRARDLERYAQSWQSRKAQDDLVAALYKGFIPSGPRTPAAPALFNVEVSRDGTSWIKMSQNVALGQKRDATHFYQWGYYRVVKA